MSVSSLDEKCPEDIKTHQPSNLNCDEHLKNAVSSSSGVIGENYIICELYRNGFIPLVSPNPQNESWDIVVINSTTKSCAKLQVKGLNWLLKAKSTSPVITGNFNSDFDFLVIVIINFIIPNPSLIPYLVYIIPKEDLEDMSDKKQEAVLPTTNDQKIKFKNNTIPFSRFATPEVKKILDCKYKEQWDKIRLFLNKN